MMAVSKSTLKSALPIPMSQHGEPIVFFDGVPTVGHSHGIMALTLSVVVYLPASDGTVQAANKVIASLRTTLAGAKILRDSIDKALLLAEPTPTQKN